jgi:hypothetical protein
MDGRVQLKIRASLPRGKSPLSIKHNCPRERVDRKVSATAKKQNPFFGRPANSLVTSPTDLLQELEVSLPCSQTLTKGTNVSRVSSTTQGPHSVLSRRHLEPLLRAQSCWGVKLTFHFQLYTSLRR